MLEAHICERCESQEIFLRKKGNATGLYCKECGKWYKWIGKKDVKTYNHRGFKVHPENYEPNPQPVPSEPIGVPFDPKQHGIQSDPLPDSFGVIEEEDFDFDEEPQSHNALRGNNSHHHHNEPNEQQIEKPTCPTCATGVLESLSQSDDISFSISRGTIRVMNKNKTKILGAFALTHCPTCGEII